MKRALMAFVLVSSLLASAAAPAAMAQSNSSTSDDPAPNPWISTDVTKDVHEMSWGDNASEALQYEADNGDIVSLNASVNSSADNPISFVASDVNATDFKDFPHQKNDVMWTDATEWSKSGANSSKLSVSSSTTAPSVDALSVATDGSMSAGSTATASFSNVSVDSDVEKRYLQFVGDINSIEAGASVQLRVTDNEGDYLAATINTSRSSGEDLIANASGEGIVYQRQLGKMAVKGSGDGSIDAIESVNLNIADGDADVDVAALNVDKMSMWSLGERKVDTDSDDEMETETIRETKTGGPIAVHGLETLGPTFDDATIHGLTTSVEFSAADLGESNKMVNYSAADNYPSFSTLSTVYYRLSLPSAYELSYGNAMLQDTQKLPANRYQKVAYAEATGDTDFEDISSWTTMTSDYSSVGKNVTIDSTVQPGQNLVFRADYLLTDEEKKNQKEAGVVAPPNDSSGGFLRGLLMSPWTWLVSAGGVLVRWKTNILGG